MKEKKSFDLMMKKYKGKQKLLIAEGLIFGLFSYWVYSVLVELGGWHNVLMARNALAVAVIDALIAIWFTVRLFRGTSFKNEEEFLRKNRLLIILAVAVPIINIIINFYFLSVGIDNYIESKKGCSSPLEPLK